MSCNFLPKWYIQALAEQQEQVMRVQACLPGKYSFDQVEGAIRASGLMPEQAYAQVAANEPTPALRRLYEALNGPK